MAFGIQCIGLYTNETYIFIKQNINRYRDKNYNYKIDFSNKILSNPIGG